MKRLLAIIAIIITLTCMESKAVIYPRPLKPGDKIAVLAPASSVKKEYVDESIEVIRSLGYVPVVFPSAYGHAGHFSAPRARRLADMEEAFKDTTIRAILCARGGYGVVQNLEDLERIHVELDPKWVIGFSDITALHAFMTTRDIASIHASMCHHLRLGPSDPDNAALFALLQGEFPSYEFPADPRNHHGRAEGRIMGGNLSVLQALIDTPYDIVQPGTILFIEDVSEPIYKIQRMLYQLKLSGMLSKLKGIVIGKFTEYRPDIGYSTMEDMIADILAEYPDLPVAFNIPIGHVSHNVPIVESSRAILDVTPEGVTLKMTPD